MKKLSILCLTFLLIIPFTFAQIGENHPKTGDFSPVDESNWQYSRQSLGSSFNGSNATFALYSKNATRILLEIYEKPSAVNAKYDYWMKKGSDNVWRAEIANVGKVVYYGFRVWGPNWEYSDSWKRGNSSAGFKSDFDAHGNRFNPNKVVFDPYGKEMSHDRSNPIVLGSKHNAGMYGTGPAKYSGVKRREFDTGKWAPKSILFTDNTSYGRKPHLPTEDAIIYEAHVRGISIHPSSLKLQTILKGIPGMEGVQNVPDKYRGTYKGAAYIAKYLKGLGFNTIELLPVHETDNDHNPPNSPGGNYWGYMTYSYFAPDRRYAYDKSPGGPTREFKQMVKAFHDAGLEVYIDVVYNHTGEGGVWDKTGETSEITNFRGIDNAEYYALVNGSPQYYWETTGCGNNFDCSKAVVKKLVIDSLKYWTHEMGVDGFRFDLAPVLGRDRAPNYNYNRNAQLLKDIANVKAKMVAEAWDISTYAVGTFPYGWGEWNGIYRDAIRRFVKGGSVKAGFAEAFNGSYHSFNDQGGPHKSVNFITAHDGFTLMDLVSYNNKNNGNAWPFGPSDGGNSSNDSWDHSGNQELRRQQLRNFWVIQAFARGVPMGVWGDEFGRTQNGNNNPYNVDSVATWSNYGMISTDSPHKISTGGGGSYHNNFGTDKKADGKNALFLFVQHVLKTRQDHKALRQSSYHVPYHFAKANGYGLGNDDRAVRVHIQGSNVGDSDFLILINTWTSKVDFSVFAAPGGKQWKRIIDTSSWAEVTNNFWTTNQETVSGSYGVNPWSIVVLEAK